MKQNSKIAKGEAAVHCNVYDYCVGSQPGECHCWEVARTKCDFHYVFNVCTDCIVYLYARESENAEISKKDIERILQKRPSVTNH